MSVVIGDSATMHCQVSGVPQPTVRWIREGQVIRFVDHPNLRVDNGGQTLHLHSMQLIDIGVYSCVASNVAGNATKQFLLNILGQFSLLPQRKRHVGLTANVNNVLTIDGLAFVDELKSYLIHLLYTVSPKGCHQTHGGDFVKSQPTFNSNFFTTGKKRKFPIKPMYHFPPHLRYVAALPWGI